MEPFDDLKNKMRSESPLSPELNWEAMEEGIFNKMTTQEPRRKKATQPLYGKWLFFGFGILATLIVFGTIELFTGDSIIAEKLATSKKSLAMGNQETAINLSNSSKKSSIISTALSQNIQVPAIEKNLIKANSKKKAFLKEQNSSTTKISKQYSIIHKNHKITLINKTKSLDFSTNPEVSLNKTDAYSEDNSTVFNSSINFMPKALNSGQVHKACPTLAVLLPKTLVSQLIEKTPFKLVHNPNLLTQKTTNHHLSLALGSGINYWQLNQTETGKDNLLAGKDKALIGLSSSLQLNYLLQPNWAISTGLNYRQLNSRMNFFKEETTQEKRENVLVGFRILSITNDTTKIYSDTAVNVTRTRQIVHHNSFKQWSIPMMIKYLVRKNRIELGLGLGTQLTLQSKDNGRVVYQNVIDFNTENRFYSTNFTWAILGSVELNYHLNKRYFLGTQVQFSSNLSDWNAQEGLRTKPFIFQNQLILGIKF